MKSFFIYLGVFALIMVGCDFAVGLIGDRMVQYAKGGSTVRRNYIADHTGEDILIFGSSRALHHYDPDIIGDALGLEAYNCGFEGNGIICSYGFFKMVTARYYPKVIVYDVTLDYDVKVGDNHRDLQYLRPFYDRPCIDSLFWDVDRTERIKMVSKMYRYNSVFPQLAIDDFHPFRTFHKGYSPKDLEMPPELEPAMDIDALETDSLKLSCLERMIKDCDGRTMLILTVSPFYENTGDYSLEPVKSLCDRYGVPFISHYADPAFNFRKDFFYDRGHLNTNGATEYSKVIAKEIGDLARL